MHILVVDDETVIRKGIIKLLENSHPAISGITEARSGEDALLAIETKKPDLLITDIQMHRMNGLDLIEHLRKNDYEIELVILTGFAEFDYVQKALRHQVADYLLKPITQERLDEVISKILLRDPAKWMSQLDFDNIRRMKETVNELIKCVMAEKNTQMRTLLEEWFAFCGQRAYSLIELKRIMGHFQLLFRSELYLNMKEFPSDKAISLNRSASAAELFEGWYLYLAEQIAWVSEKRSPRNKRIVDEAMRYIEQRYQDTGLNLSMIADRAGVSSAYLSKMFREVMGKPITQYISEFRLEQARMLLMVEDGLKINAIAEGCGFNDYPYFSKIFKKYYGVSPLEYKEKNEINVRHEE